MNIISKDNKFSQLNFKAVFLVIYAAIGVATFYHTAWGFGTIMGYQPANTFDLAWWWFVGGLSAFAVDVGMAGIVMAMARGFNSSWLIFSLIVLAGFSAYAQVVYSAHHAVNYALGDVAPWLSDFLQLVLDLRIVLLPLVLPLFALIYAFAAKSYQVQEVQTPANKPIAPKDKSASDTKERSPVLDGQSAKPLQLKRKPESAKSASDASANIAPVQNDALQALHGLDKVQALPVIARLQMQGVEFDNASLADAIGKTPSTASRWLRDAKQLNGNGANGKH